MKTSKHRTVAQEKVASAWYQRVDKGPVFFSVLASIEDYLSIRRLQTGDSSRLPAVLLITRMWHIAINFKLSAPIVTLPVTSGTLGPTGQLTAGGCKLQPSFDRVRAFVLFFFTICMWAVTFVSIFGETLESFRIGCLRVSVGRHCACVIRYHLGYPRLSYENRGSYPTNANPVYAILKLSLRQF